MSFFRSRCGFTLFELIVAITIVALLMGVVVSRIDDLLDLEMKKTSRKLSSTIRYLYNKSATEGIYMRLVFDFEGQSYWVEATSEPFLLEASEAEKTKKEKEEKAETEKKKEAEKEEGAPSKEQEGTEASSAPRIPKLEIKKPVFTQTESYLLRPTKLPNNVFFKDVMTEHHPIPIDSGEASIYFFPNGYVEHAIINLRDEDDEVFYSLETNPITGAVKIENEYRSLEKK
jgi:prepilin-type N-terminal cleavage/methylation domain-containing protein